MKNIDKFSYLKFMSMLLAVLIALAFTRGDVLAADSLTVDIYGPGQRKVNVIILPAKTVPEGKYAGSKEKNLPLPAESATFKDALVKDFGFLPFVNMVSMNDILGGDPSTGVRPGDIDIKPLRLSKVDLAITTGWEVRPNGERNLLLRCIGTFNGRTILGKKYSMVTEAMLPRIADRFSSHLMRILTGRDGFFESKIAFVRKQGNGKEIYTVSPQGRNLRQISSLGGINLSPNWSPEGDRLVFTRLGSKQHILCVWDSSTGKIEQRTFPGNTVIGPAFLPDGEMAATLTMNGNSDIFLIDRKFKPRKALAQSWAIEVSPDFDRTGEKMVFTSARFGNPHIFMLDRKSGEVTRVTRDGKYNTNPTISPDGRYVAFARKLPGGHRIFLHDMKTGLEKQLTFGPGSDEDPAFGPDGYFIAFASSRSGKYQIYMTTRHGDDAMLVPTGNGIAKAPAWGKASNP